MALSDDRSVTSDREYLRLYSYGETTINATTSIPISDPDSLIWTYYGEYTINHNQGEIVLARAWADFGKNGLLGNAQTRNNITMRVYVRNLTNSSIVRVVSFTSISSIPVYYKVYKPA